MDESARERRTGSPCDRSRKEEAGQLEDTDEQQLAVLFEAHPELHEQKLVELFKADPTLEALSSPGAVDVGVLSWLAMVELLEAAASSSAASVSDSDAALAREFAVDAFPEAALWSDEEVKTFAGRSPADMVLDGASEQASGASPVAADSPTAKAGDDIKKALGDRGGQAMLEMVDARL